MQQPSSDSAAGPISGQDILIGQVIAGKYRIERLLGRGGMGAVYEGQHLLLERPIAIKVMQGQMAEDERAVARFLREAKAAAKIEHPNAVTIYDFGILQGNVAYIVMEYIRGRSLRQWLVEYNAAPAQQAVEWLAQACEAVAAAHEQGIIHRDLKPENIMLKEGVDGKLTVKVVDFGLAKLVSGDPGSGVHITKTGEVLGTPYYMAPEFYDGEQVDQRADIYALGIITYEMISGQAPFTGTVESIIAGHLFKELPSLHDTNNAIPKLLDEIIASAVQKKRSERLASASQFAALLRTVFVATNVSPLAPPTRSATAASHNSQSVSIPSGKHTTRDSVVVPTAKPTEVITTNRSAEQKDNAASIFSRPTVLMNDASLPQRPTVSKQIEVLPTTAVVLEQPNKKRRFFLAVASLVVVITALTVGLTLGLNRLNRQSTPTPPETVNPTPPVVTQPATQSQPTVVIEEPTQEAEPTAVETPSKEKDEYVDSGIEGLPSKPIKRPSSEKTDNKTNSPNNTATSEVTTPANPANNRPAVEPSNQGRTPVTQRNEGKQATSDKENKENQNKEEKDKKGIRNIFNKLNPFKKKDKDKKD
ncbi:MAG: protein kinase [Acidobacteriota bacterium]